MPDADARVARLPRVTRAYLLYQKRFSCSMLLGFSGLPLLRLLGGTWLGLGLGRLRLFGFGISGFGRSGSGAPGRREFGIVRLGFGIAGFGDLGLLFGRRRILGDLGRIGHEQALVQAARRRANLRKCERVAPRVCGAVHREHGCARRCQRGSVRVLAGEAGILSSRKPHRRLGWGARQAQGRRRHPAAGLCRRAVRRAGAGPRGARRGPARGQIDLELEKLVHEGLGQFHASAFAIHGQGLSAELDDIYGVSGNVAPSDVRLFEAWIEQPIGKVTIRAGLFSADQEFILAKHSTALLNATFGIISQLSYNLLGPGVSGRDARRRGAPRAHGLHRARRDLRRRSARTITASRRSRRRTSLVIGEVAFDELVQVGALASQRARQRLLRDPRSPARALPRAGSCATGRARTSSCRSTSMRACGSARAVPRARLHRPGHRVREDRRPGARRADRLRGDVPGAVRLADGPARRPGPPRAHPHREIFATRATIVF